jgi:hypothetical protein
MQGDHGHGGDGAEAVEFGDTCLIQIGSFLTEGEALTPRGGAARIRAARARVRRRGEVAEKGIPANSNSERGRAAAARRNAHAWPHERR